MFCIVWEKHREKNKNLILIGNGFDQWQDLPTAYAVKQCFLDGAGEAHE